MILRIENLSKHFGGLKAIDNVNLEVREKEIVGIIGPNGAGKTTLFNMISGAIPPTSGKVYFNNELISHLKPYQLCKKGIGRTYQVVRPFNNITVLENVMVGAFNHISSLHEARVYSMDVLKKVGLEKEANKLAKSLTIANKKRLEVARALATKPKLLLLDEVMAGLNPSEVKEILPVIHRLRDEEGITILVIEHIMEVIMNISDRIIVMHHGRKIAEGTPEEVVNNEEVIKAYLGEEITIA